MEELESNTFLGLDGLDSDPGDFNAQVDNRDIEIVTLSTFDKGSVGVVL